MALSSACLGSALTVWLLNKDISGKSTHAVFLIIQTAVVALVGVHEARFYRSCREVLLISLERFCQATFSAIYWNCWFTWRAHAPEQANGAGKSSLSSVFLKRVCNYGAVIGKLPSQKKCN